MEVKYSIIVPVYNVEKYLPKCLDSLINQNFSDYEIIIVDDGSPDGSGKIADAYAEKYSSLISVIHQKNKGLGGARNTGIDKAKGEYLCFIDSDDWVADNFLTRLDEELNKNDLDILIFNAHMILENGKIIGNFFNSEEKFRFVDNRILITGGISACDKIYKKSLFTETGVSFPEHMPHEDLATIPKLAIYAERVASINDCLYYYLQRKTSIMHNLTPDSIVRIIDCVDTVLDCFKQKGEFEKYYYELEYMAVGHILYCGVSRLLKLKGKIRWDYINILQSYMNSNFPDYMEDSRGKNSLIYKRSLNSEQYKCIINKKYRYARIRFFGLIRFKNFIKRILFKLGILKD